MNCSETGYSGRTVAAEIVVIDALMTDKIADGVKVSELESILRKQKHLFLYDDALEKAHTHITTTDEIKRELGGPL